MDNSDEENCNEYKCALNKHVYCPREKRCARRENSYRYCLTKSKEIFFLNDLIIVVMELRIVKIIPMKKIVNNVMEIRIHFYAIQNVRIYSIE